MPATQLEPNLWSELEQAATTPEQANLSLLWAELEQLIDGLPNELRLQTAGRAIEQIVEVSSLRSAIVLTGWEESHSRAGPSR